MSLVSMLKSYPNHSVIYFHFYFGRKHTQMEANVLIFLMFGSKGKKESKNQLASAHELDGFPTC